MSEKEGFPPTGPTAPAPPSYGQAVGYQGYGTSPGVPSYAAPGQPGYNTNYNSNYGTGQQNVIMRQPGGYGYAAVNPAPDHMGLAILATVLCCWPIGIIAIMKAMDARRALDRGDMPTAMMNSAQAKRYSLIAIGFGTALVVIVVVTVAVVVSSSSYYY